MNHWLRYLIGSPTSKVEPKKEEPVGDEALTIDAMIDEVIRREGGFVNHKNDRGGATNWGITIGTLKGYRGKSVTVNDVKNLTKAEAKAIYKKNYWSDPGFDQLDLDPVVIESVFDAAVNHGTKNAKKFLQRAIGVADDGIIGPVTRTAIENADQAELACNFIAERVIFFGRIITNNKSQAVFAHGWLRRAAEFIRKLKDV